MPGTQRKKAIIIGAGPAGLTAAFELLQKGEYQPIVFEATDMIGGISQTAVYKGNRMDIGGHRFFSKSDRVIDWWLNMMPLEQSEEGENSVAIQYQGQTHLFEPNTVESRGAEHSMLIRKRLSRIYFDGQFFDYPLSLSFATLRKLGMKSVFRIGASYIWKTITPNRKEVTLEDFFINRFGCELYETFFKSYTEKVWGKQCTEISAEWGKQRVKGLSLRTAIVDALKRPFRWNTDVRQKATETSLIQQFMYPAYGPGHMWETVAQKIEAAGGVIHMKTPVDRVIAENGTAVGVVTIDKNGNATEHRGDVIISTMPIQQLVMGLENVPAEVERVASGLEYRDFMVVGALLQKNQIGGALLSNGKLIEDNWLYIQEPHVRVGRMQIFNNWSPFLVANEQTAWVGMEYFASVGDDLWSLTDEDIQELAIKELQELGFAANSPADTVLIRMPKAYPAYTGTYMDFHIVQEYIDSIKNLYVIGRNGMHKYNNQDHSMLTAMKLVDGLAAGSVNREELWSVNTEQEYHESR